MSRGSRKTSNRLGDVVVGRNNKTVLDKNGNEIRFGDTITFKGNECVLLNHHGVPVLFRADSRWYGDDRLSSQSYGKGFDLPLDNGARMHLEVVK